MLYLCTINSENTTDYTNGSAETAAFPYAEALIVKGLRSANGCAT